MRIDEPCSAFLEQVVNWQWGISWPSGIWGPDKCSNCYFPMFGFLETKNTFCPKLFSLDFNKSCVFEGKFNPDVSNLFTLKSLKRCFVRLFRWPGNLSSIFRTLLLTPQKSSCYEELTCAHRPCSLTLLYIHKSDSWDCSNLVGWCHIISQFQERK